MPAADYGLCSSVEQVFVQSHFYNAMTANGAAAHDLAGFSAKSGRGNGKKPFFLEITFGMCSIPIVLKENYFHTCHVKARLSLCPD